MTDSAEDVFELLEEGYYALSTHDLDSAETIGQSVMALSPSHPEVENFVGAVAMAKGMYNDALVHFETALSADPGFIGALLNVSQALTNLDRLEEAAEHLSQASKWVVSEEDRVEILLQHIMLKTRANLMDDAVALCKELPDTCEEPSLSFRVGQWLFDLGDVERAEPLIEGAVRDGFVIGDSAYYQGLLRGARGDRAGSVVSFLQARDFDLRGARPPWFESTSAFERRIGNVLRTLPEPVRTQLDGALVLVLSLPAPELICEGIDPRLPLLIEPTRGETDMVTRVFAYQLNLERTVLLGEQLDARIKDEIILEATEAFKMTRRSVLPSQN